MYHFLRLQCILFIDSTLNAHKADENSKLYSILFQVIDQLYGLNLGCDEPLSNSELLSQIFKLEDRLVNWQRELTNDLQLVDSDTVAVHATQLNLIDSLWVTLRLRIILTLRQTNLRLLLHRPVILRLLDRNDYARAGFHDDSLLQQMGTNSVRVCLNSASQLISLVHAALVHPALEGQQTKGDLLGAWWFSLYYSKSKQFETYSTVYN